MRSELNILRGRGFLLSGTGEENFWLLRKNFVSFWVYFHYRTAMISVLSVDVSFLFYFIEDWTGNILLFGIHSKEKWMVARRCHTQVTDTWWVVDVAICFSFQGNMWYLINDTWEILCLWCWRICSNLWVCKDGKYWWLMMTARNSLISFLLLLIRVSLISAS